MTSFKITKCSKKKLHDCNSENERLKEELVDAQKRPAASGAGATNFDLLKRISNLEKHVFGSKLFSND